MRVVAAATLGLMGNDGSVEALTAALAGDDPVTRQAAASSLAQIRSEAASAALLHAYLSGDDGVRRPIAVAIASHGHPTAQAALAGSCRQAQPPSTHVRAGALSGRIRNEEMTNRGAQAKIGARGPCSPRSTAPSAPPPAR